MTDFTDNVDVISLAEALWGGGKTVSQVLADYGVIVGSNAHLDFGGGNALIVDGVTNLSILQDDIVFV